MQDIISRFADIVALLYHEGRNVRHLVKNSKLPLTEGLQTLINGLARNRFDAWKQIQPLRRKASKARSGGDVLQVFERKFRLTLDDLVALYAHPSWKGTPYGGNAWLPIARKTAKARNILEAGLENEARQLLEEIMESCHNTGKVCSKIKELDKQLAEANHL